MPRKTRTIIPGIAHHVVQRGNNHQTVFEDETDYGQYCQWVSKYAVLHKVEILAYCLMPNHVHFIMIPQEEQSIGQMLNTVQMRQAQYMNKIRKTSGHLWQGRYFSCSMDEEHLYRAIRYVEQNPTRACMVKEPWEYPWSSTRERLGLDQKPKIFLKDTTIADRREWKEYLKEADAAFNENIRQKTRKGIVLGNTKFIRQWENRLGKVLHELKPGRPDKRRAKARKIEFAQKIRSK